MIALAIDHLHEVVEGVEGGSSRDVVDEEEGVGFEVRGGPEAAVFFLPGRVGEGEEVGMAVYGAGGGVGVLWGSGIRDKASVKGREVRIPIVGSYL